MASSLLTLDKRTRTSNLQLPVEFRNRLFNYRFGHCTMMGANVNNIGEALAPTRGKHLSHAHMDSGEPPAAHKQYWHQQGGCG